MYCYTVLCSTILQCNQHTIEQPTLTNEEQTNEERTNERANERTNEEQTRNQERGRRKLNFSMESNEWNKKKSISKRVQCALNDVNPVNVNPKMELNKTKLMRHSFLDLSVGFFISFLSFLLFFFFFFFWFSSQKMEFKWLIWKKGGGKNT